MFNNNNHEYPDSLILIDLGLFFENYDHLNRFDWIPQTNLVLNNVDKNTLRSFFGTSTHVSTSSNIATCFSFVSVNSVVMTILIQEQVNTDFFANENLIFEFSKVGPVDFCTN